MDLGAYAMIDVLDEVAKKNGISINRCRGYRLMKYESKMTDKEINEHFDWVLREVVNDYFSKESTPIPGLISHHYGEEYKRKIKEYTTCENIENIDEEKWQLDWNKIHGELEKELKKLAEDTKKACFNQDNLWNSMCGRDDVLYCHAKQGRHNWGDTSYLDYKDEDWFIDAIEDAWDTVYCDIYCKIDPETIKDVDDTIE